MGGTTSAAPVGGIRCTLPSGTAVDCSFNTTEGTAACQWTKDLPPKSAKALIGDVPPASMAPPTTTTKPPKATGVPATHRQLSRAVTQRVQLSSAPPST